MADFLSCSTVCMHAYYEIPLIMSKSGAVKRLEASFFPLPIVSLILFFFFIFSMSESLLISSFFFLISIRLNSQKPWPYLQNKFKSWKSWLTWTVVQFLALCKQYGRKYQKLRYCWLAKKLLNHTFFVKLRNFKRAFLRSHSIYQAQCFRDNWNCYIFSIFRDFILLASSGNDKHIP